VSGPARLVCLRPTRLYLRLGRFTSDVFILEALLNVVLRTGYLVSSDRRPPPYALLIVKVEYKVCSSQACEHRNRDHLSPSFTIFANAKNMGIPGDIGIPATENLRLYLSQAILPLMKIPRNAPRVPPSGHRSHNIGFTTRPERYRRLESIQALGMKVETEVPKCMRSPSSLLTRAHSRDRNNDRLKPGDPRLPFGGRRSRLGDRKCHPHPLQSDV